MPAQGITELDAWDITLPWPTHVIPAKARIQLREAQKHYWIPAFAGMTLCSRAASNAGNTGWPAQAQR
jgi:hypothetical protein